MTEYIEKAALYKRIADYEQERMKALFSEKNFNRPQAREKQGLLNSATIIKHMVADIPVADVRPVVHGKWVYKGKGDLGWFECSICSYPYWSERDNYCPRCGAVLREDSNG